MIQMTTSRWENQIVKINGKIKRPRFDWAEIFFFFFLIVNIGTPPFHLDLWGKTFKSMLPKAFSLVQLRMCFAQLKNYRIPIFNAAMVIKTIVSVK